MTLNTKARLRAGVMVVAVGLCSHLAVAQSKQVSTTVTASDAQFTLDLSSVSSFDKGLLTIQNVGTTPVIMPEVEPSGTAPSTNATAIVAWLRAQAGTSDRALAEAAWRWVLAHSFAYCTAASPYETGYGADNPWRVFRGYGFGCCGQMALMLDWLWTRAGLTARTAGWTAHAVAEVYYDNAWHMYDANHRVFYTAKDGTVASVAMVVADPTLVATATGPDGLDPVGWTVDAMMQVYTNANVIYSTPSFTTPQYAEPTYALAPGETLYINSENIVADIMYRYADGAWGLGPSAVNSATLIRNYDFSTSNWKSSVYNSSGMDAVSTPSGIALTNTAATGNVVLAKDWPAPAFDCQLDGEFYRASSDAKINVYFSADGVNWTGPFIISTPVGVTQKGSLAMNRQARGAYSTYVKVEAVSSAPGAVRISWLKTTSNVQVAKTSFPALVPGTNNRLVYRDGNPISDQRAISITLSVYRDAPAPDGMLLPLAQNTTLPPAASVTDMESSLRAPQVFYPWLAYLPSSASQGLWSAQQQGSTLQAVAPATDLIPLSANLTFNVSGSSPITWGLAERDPVSLNFDWVQPPVTTTWPYATVQFPAVGDQFVLASSGGGTIQLFGRPAYRTITAVSLVPENPVYSLAAGYGAPHLVDDWLRTLAYPGGTQFDYQIDLGTLTHVTAATMLWGVFGSNPIYVQKWTLYGRRSSSDDWAVLGQGGFPGAETTKVDLDAYASQLRIVASALNWIGMYELSVAASPVLPLTATSNVHELTSISTMGPASLLVDGDEATLAYPGSSYMDYTLDPGGNAYVDQVRIVWGYYGTHPLYVDTWRLYGQKQVGTTWTVIARGVSPGAAESIISVHTNYRRLRIAASSTYWIGIYEVQVYGNRLAP